jgi:aminopeptidase N
MLDAMKRKQWDEAKELADALYEWIRKGGFPPVTVGDESLGQQWHKTIASFTCLVVANKVDDVKKRRSRRQTTAKDGF